MQKETRRNLISNKIFHDQYFYHIVWRDFPRWVIFTGQLQNPWQMLPEPPGSVEPRLKITELLTHSPLWPGLLVYWPSRLKALAVN